MRYPRFHRSSLLVVLLVLLMGQAGAKAAQKDPWEARATWLMVFAYLTAWPPEILPKPESPLKIGVLGENPQILRALQAGIKNPDPLVKPLKARSNNRPITVTKCVNPEEAEHCHVVYVSFTEKDQWPQILRNLQNKSLITVGETEPFASLGGVIAFEDEGNRLAFSANPEQVRRLQQESVKISLDLLALVRFVPK